MVQLHSTYGRYLAGWFKIWPPFSINQTKAFWYMFGIAVYQLQGYWGHFNWQSIDTALEYSQPVGVRQATLTQPEKRGMILILILMSKYRSMSTGTGAVGTYLSTCTNGHKHLVRCWFARLIWLYVYTQVSLQTSPSTVQYIPVSIPYTCQWCELKNVWNVAHRAGSFRDGQTHDAIKPVIDIVAKLKLESLVVDTIRECCSSKLSWKGTAVSRDQSCTAKLGGG